MKKKYKYTMDSSFENALYDCKLVDDSIVDDETYQEADCGLVLAYMDRILEALEKQVPKKVVYSNYDDNGFDEIIPHKAECPVCGYEFEFGEFNDIDNPYCKCGQKLDWKDDKKRLQEAIKIFNFEKLGTKEEQLEAVALVLKSLFNVDVQNDDGSYKNMYNVLEEVSKSFSR